jgi:hypothetical protein
MFTPARKFRTSSGGPTGPCRCAAALLLALLFAQWAVGLAIRVETEAERADACRPAASLTSASLPECRVSLPPEQETFLQANLFYQAAVVPAIPFALPESSSPRIATPPLRWLSAVRAILRRPPR